MKNLFYLSLTFVTLSFYTASVVNGQGVSVNVSGNAPDNSAGLDVNFNNKGVLIPRVSLSSINDVSTIPTPANYLTVFNTNSSMTGGNGKGMYYYDGSKWMFLAAAANGAGSMGQVLTSGGAGGTATWTTPSSGWALSGNTGTISGTNFIGTTDNQALDVRTNNTVKLRISPKGQLEIFNTGISVFMGESAGANDDLSNNSNVFVGYNSGKTNTTGDANVGIGSYTLLNNLTGAGNVAMGDGSLFSNTDGASNTGIGFQALYSNTKGYNNVALGWYAMRNSTTAVNNVAIGFRALSVQSFSNSNNIWNSFNTAIGGYALENNNSTATGNGIGNTALGQWSLQTNTTGSYNTAVGYNAHNTGATYDNSIAVGTDAPIDASNQIRLGNNNITSFKCKVSLTTTSDSRVKANVQENVPGLSFINLLRPVTYQYDLAKENELTGISGDTDWKDKYDIESIRFSGFIAQEVQEAAQNTGYDFSGIDKSSNLMGLRYAEFTVPIVKAIQELNEKVEKLEHENRELKSLLCQGSVNRESPISSKQ